MHLLPQAENRLLKKKLAEDKLLSCLYVQHMLPARRSGATTSRRVTEAVRGTVLRGPEHGGALAAVPTGAPLGTGERIKLLLLFLWNFWFSHLCPSPLVLALGATGQSELHPLASLWVLRDI